MKKILFAFILFFIIGGFGGTGVSPSSGSSSSNCGCSKYNKSDCQGQYKCKWVVSNGCKCA